MAQYRYRDETYTIVECTNEDIPSHVERVLFYWESTNTNIKFQSNLMKQCVTEHSAYKLIDSNNITKGFIYLMPINSTTATGHAMWFEDKRMFSIIGAYLMYHTQLHHIIFQPHQRKEVPFKFMLTEFNIMEFYNSEHPIDINIYSEKCVDLVKRYFLDAGIEEI